MTQLVELQEARDRFAAEGIKLYAISYDEPRALAEFARHHDIDFPLLADRGSQVIRRYGILNTYVPPEQVPFYGIPFPGTYLVDEAGVVTDKFFHPHHALRVSAASVIDSALGRILLGENDGAARGGDEEVRLSVALHGGRGVLNAASIRHLVVRFELPTGLHIYGEPVPEGMVATRIEVNGPPGLHVEEPILPPTRALHLEALNVELQVWEGVVDIAIPIWADSELAPVVDLRAPDHATLDVTVRYQACDHHSCHLPRHESLSLLVPIKPVLTHALIGNAPNSWRSPMNTRKYMARMILRGLVRSPIRGLRHLLQMRRNLRDGPGSPHRRHEVANGELRGESDDTVVR